MKPYYKQRLPEKKRKKIISNQISPIIMVAKELMLWIIFKIFKKVLDGLKD